MENNQNNPLLCDITSGSCEMPEAHAALQTEWPAPQPEPARIIYFTDPICSSCWGIEPQLRRLKLEYGHSIRIDYRMGGLLPDWSYNSGGISRPSHVAHHWDEVSIHYDMPIDGDVWLEDPLHSSYPPSIAFKAAQLQGEHKAVLFLREIREMVFLKKLNITKLENLLAAAENVGLNVSRFEDDYKGNAPALFKQDLSLAAQLGVRGFPTMFFIDGEGNMEKVYGVKPYSAYEHILLKQHPDINQNIIDTHWEKLFAKYSTLTSREFSELSQTSRQATDDYLQSLVNAGSLSKVVTKNGILWVKAHSKN